VHLRRVLTLVLAVLVCLVACGGDSGPPGGGGSATIAGHVVDGYGQPVAGRTVLIGASSTTTDASGAFTLTGVATPYDLVILAAAPTKAATVYTQLTRTDPRVPDLAAGNPTPLTATVKGALSGGAPLPTTPGTLTLVAWGSPDQAVGGDYVTSSPYSFDVSWVGPTTITGAVHGLQWTIDQNSTVTGYLAHGVKTGVSLSNAATVTADLALTAPLTDNISVTATPPASHEIFERDVFLTFDDGTLIQVSGDGLDGGSLQVPVPSDIGAKALVRFRAISGDGSMETDAQLTGLDAGTAGAALSLPPPARLTAPANGATGVDTSTDLVWTPVTAGIHFIFLNGTANDPSYAIVSGGTRARIPDLSAHGLGLPSGHAYDLALVAFGPYASIDAFAQTGVLPKEGPGFNTASLSGFTTR
jgi:hypothetical protein